jgi:hypothetical protein
MRVIAQQRYESIHKRLHNTDEQPTFIDITGTPVNEKESYLQGSVCSLLSCLSLRLR